MSFTRTRMASVALVALLAVGASCSTEDQVNDALKDSGIEGNVTLEGDLPADFPKDEVPTPDLALETGIGLQGNFTLRYTSKDAVGDVAAYRSAVAEDGFNVTSDFDNSADPSGGGNVGFIASNDDWAINVSAFGPDAPGGGNYMAVVVMPA